MAQVIVRNLDDAVVSSLKFKAELHGHSLEQELRDILKEAAELTPEEKLALIERIRAKQERRLEDDSTDLIRADRDFALMLVVDYSVAVKWFLEEPGDREALALLRTGERLIAPELIVAELVNVLWKRITTGAITHSQAADVPQAIPKTLAELCPLAPLAARALAIAAELRHPAYDCFYLALAEVRDLKLITADRRLVARLAESPWQERCLRLWN